MQGGIVSFVSTSREGCYCTNVMEPPLIFRLGCGLGAVMGDLVTMTTVWAREGAMPKREGRNQHLGNRWLGE